MNKVCIFLSIILIIVSCNTRRPAISVTVFQQEAMIEGTVVKIKPIVFAPEKMFVLNGNLWIFQSRKDTLFDVFRLSDYRYLYSAGTKGKGPDEFVFPQGQTIQPTNTGFTIFDNYAMKTITLDSNTLHIASTNKIFSIFPVNGFSRLNDHIFCAFAYCATGREGDHEYRMVDSRNRTEKTFSDYPRLSSKEYKGDERCQIYYKYLAVNPSKGKFAAFYSHFKFFRIYDYEGNIEKEISVDIEPCQSDQLDNWEERMVYYRMPVATARFIYALCLNGREEQSLFQPEIQVWDWEGTPIIRYALDRHFTAYTVSEEHKRLYATSDENIDELFVYELTHLNDYQ